MKKAFYFEAALIDDMELADGMLCAFSELMDGAEHECCRPS